MYSLFMYLCLFFFFKQKTAYEMRISDWSSDVCSSDLSVARAAELACQGAARRQARSRREAAGQDDLAHLVVELLLQRRRRAAIQRQRQKRRAAAARQARSGT